MSVPDLFRSKRWWSAVVGLVFMAAVHFIPALAADQDTLTKSALIIIGLLIGGYSVEDAVTATQQPSTGLDPNPQSHA